MIAASAVDVRARSRRIGGSMTQTGTDIARSPRREPEGTRPDGSVQQLATGRGGSRHYGRLTDQRSAMVANHEGHEVHEGTERSRTFVELMPFSFAFLSSAPPRFLRVLRALRGSIRIVRRPEFLRAAEVLPSGPQQRRNCHDLHACPQPRRTRSPKPGRLALTRGLACCIVLHNTRRKVAHTAASYIATNAYAETPHCTAGLLYCK